MATNKIKAVKSYFRKELSGMYETEEIEKFIFYAFEAYLGFSRSDLVLREEEGLNESDLLWFVKVVKALKAQRPIQYILGAADFYGLKLKVNEHVLIPRQETEELVDWIIKDNIGGNGLRILDIGTGSGCIPIALKKQLPDAKVYALDYSKEALDVATDNAKNNDVEIEFIRADILEDKLESISALDIIVSNPPYVRLVEKSEMHKNVLEYEPHQALFVSDDNPLLFYDRIAGLALQKLIPGGKIYFEINEVFGKEVVALLENKGFTDVVLKKDLSGKDRMVSGFLGNQ